MQALPLLNISYRQVVIGSGALAAVSYGFLSLFDNKSPIRLENLTPPHISYKPIKPSPNNKNNDSRIKTIAETVFYLAAGTFLAANFCWAVDKGITPLPSSID